MNSSIGNPLNYLYETQLRIEELKEQLEKQTSEEKTKYLAFVGKPVVVRRQPSIDVDTVYYIEGVEIWTQFQNPLRVVLVRANKDGSMPKKSRDRITGIVWEKLEFLQEVDFYRK